MRNLFTYDNFIVEKKKTLHPFHGSLNREERNEFIEKLQKNIIVFRYKKRDGSIRKAEGTLHPKYLPPPKSDKEFVRPEYQIVYFDIDKKDWRSFRSFEFIEILSTRPVISKRDEEDEKDDMDKSMDKIDIVDDIDDRDKGEILKDKRKKKSDE